MLGANLTLRLVKDGYSVRILTRSARHPMVEGLPITEHRGDLENEDDINAAMDGCRFVFHAAGFISQKRSDKDAMFRSNVTAARNIVQACLAHNVERLVHTSSTAAVGWSRKPESVLNEDSPIPDELKRVPYAWTKKLAEGAVLEGVKEGLDAVMVNPATIYGSGDIKLNTGKALLALKSGKVLLAPPGGQSVVAVDDVVEGHVLALEKGQKGRRYILASGNMSYFDFLKRAAVAIEGSAPGRKLPRAVGPPLNAVAGVLERIWASSPLSVASSLLLFRYRYHSAERAKKELGWIPKVALEDAIREAMEFYRKM